MSKLPGPTLFSLFSNIGMIRKDPLAVTQQFLDQYGDAIELRLGWMHIMAFNHPKYYDQILRKNYQFFPKSDQYKKVSEIMGQGLATSEGEFWKENRVRLQKLFSKEKFDNYFNAVDKICCDYLNNIKDGDTKDFYSDMMKFALASITSTLFNKDYSSQSQEVSQALQIFMQGMEDRIFQVIPFADKIPTKKNRTYQQAIAFLKQTVANIVAEKAKEDFQNQDDLISILLSSQQKDGSITDEYIRDEVMTFFIAGHETTASAITWLVYLLAKNPSWYQKVKDEVATLDRVGWSFENIEKIKSLDNIVNESLRLYPPLWMTSRQATKDIFIENIKIKKGTIIVLSPYFLHRDNRFWVDSLEYNPERFEFDLVKDSFQPFSIGPRGCIGERFSKMEVKILITRMIQNFDFSIEDIDKVSPLPTITMRPKDGLHVKFNRRKI